MGMHVMAVSGLQFVASRLMRPAAKQSARYLHMHPDSTLGFHAVQAHVNEAARALVTLLVHHLHLAGDPADE